MPYPNEHAARLKDPARYVRFRRENNKFGDGIHAIWGITEDGTVELQAIRFDKGKFTPEQARKWLKDHDFSPAAFEAAKAVSTSVETTTIERTAVLLEEGDYPDKELKVDTQLLDHLVSNFKEPVPVVVEHKPESLQLGWLGEVWRKGKQLLGKLVLRHSASELIDETGVKGVSVGLVLQPQPQLEEVSITANPRVAAAQVFSATAVSLDGCGILLSADEQNQATVQVTQEVTNQMAEEKVKPTQVSNDNSEQTEELDVLRKQLSDLQQQLELERERARQARMELRQKEVDMRLQEWKQTGKVLPAQEPYARALLNYLLLDNDEGELRRVKMAVDGVQQEISLLDVVERMLSIGATAVTKQMGNALPHDTQPKSVSSVPVPEEVVQLYRDKFGLSGELLDAAVKRYAQMNQDRGGEG